MEAPYGVLHAFNKLSLPVDTNHLPQAANFKLNTQLSCKCSWYLSGFVACSTSTFEFSIPTASQSPKMNKRKLIKMSAFYLKKKLLPVGQYPNENICDVKSCCCNCLPSRKSQDRTVLSKPPVHNLFPSGLMSIQEAPSVCPWNCLTSVWLWRSHTAILPSEQHEKHTLESGLIANA